MTTNDIPSPIRHQATVHGYPRQGPNRQLKKALERYWNHSIDLEAFLSAVADVRRARFETLVSADLDEIPVGDFSLYDHLLDLTCLLGAVPNRYRQGLSDPGSEQGRLERYFAMARGTADLAPLEMTKWFDTNYHYLVPELAPDTVFALDPAPLLAEITEAQQYGRPVRPVLVGPFTFLKLAKAAESCDGFDPLSLLDRLVPVYRELLSTLAATGVAWVQLDEPSAVTDLSPSEVDRLVGCYRSLAGSDDRPKLLLGSYFGRLGDAAPALVAAGVDGLALDLTDPDAVADVDRLTVPTDRPFRLVAGVVDGRNVWRTDLEAALRSLESLQGSVGQLDVAPSCSLLHVPHDVGSETNLDPEVAGWLAFADQKLAEVTTLARGLNDGREAIETELSANRDALASRRASALAHDDEVRARTGAVDEDQLRRRSPYAVRAETQHRRLRLPVLPTTTIGSFPQTVEVRRARADFRAGRSDAESYEKAMRAEIDAVVDFQTRIGLDVLVHGEPERNDMVQYFAEQLDGVVTTEHGWVQSYGSRYVRPPIIAGDITRPKPMTSDWARYAQSRADGPVKGMLTGPVTMLAWSFVRDDQPTAETARQMALALRQEVQDLEQAGIGIIQVDEPALRETLPLREADRPAYLDWAVDAFRLTTAGVADETQIHTHMCYAEFADILTAIVAMDADVISLEAARSRMEIVAELAEDDYPREVGPGVWDIHSPRVPGVDEIAEHLRAAVRHLPPERLWVNPDCGLKTRGWPEVEASLQNLVAATRLVRAELA